ncbi:MAG: polyprenol monophosphomannose synthase [Candidatus Kerfeldbacteria bacterium]|nr:polyprenol monophosphomannose synthase [Candidatus Kerfeldbacteria bacterium]
MKLRAAFILPTYNEAENLRELVPRLAGLERQAEIVVVDDGSPDGTEQVANELAKQNPVRLLERRTKRGLASAVVDGVKAAQAPVVVVMDADLSHDEQIAPQLIAAIEAGSEVAVGSRFASGGSTEDVLVRRWFSWCAKQVARVVLGVRVQDPMSGFFAIRRDDFLRVAQQLKPRGFKILLELLVRLKPTRVTEIGFRFRSRTKGESKLTLTIALQYFRMIFDLWRARR